MSKSVSKYVSKSVKVCPKCKKDTFLDLFSKACDGNYYSLCKKEGTIDKEGYMPVFKGLTNSDGCELSICLNCGTLQGLDVKALRKKVMDVFKDDIVHVKKNKKSIEDDEEDDNDEKEEPEESESQEEMKRVFKKKKLLTSEKPPKKSGSKTARNKNKAPPKRNVKPPKKSNSKTAKKNANGKSSRGRKPKN